MLANPYLEIKKAIELKDIEPLIDEYIKSDRPDCLRELIEQTLTAERIEYILTVSPRDAFYLEDILKGGFRGYYSFSVEQLLREFDETIFYFLDWEEEQGEQIVARVAEFLEVE